MTFSGKSQCLLKLLLQFSRLLHDLAQGLGYLALCGTDFGGGISSPLRVIGLCIYSHNLA